MAAPKRRKARGGAARHVIYPGPQEGDVLLWDPGCATGADELSGDRLSVSFN